jgi:hypothetical protein
MPATSSGWSVVPIIRVPKDARWSASRDRLRMLAQPGDDILTQDVEAVVIDDERLQLSGDDRVLDRVSAVPGHM